MASQLFTIAVIAGQAAAAVRDRFAHWDSTASQDSESGTNPEVDAFCEALQRHRTDLTILYYCQWIDRWLFGADVSKEKWQEGKRFSACALRPEQAERLAQRPPQDQENAWMATRLKEASEVWKPPAGDTVMVVIRQILGVSADDREIVAACDTVPEWLSR